MRSLKLWPAASALALMVAACDSAPDAEPDRPEPVVVYASYADETYLPGLFAGFTNETGVPVTVRYGEPSRTVDDVIADRGSPPADVLLATNVADIWRAADEGALRPLTAGNRSNIVDFLRDPDDLWVAVGLRIAVIAYGQDVENKPESYQGLAEPAYRGRLCLSSSSLPVNRSLIAMLIAELGVRPAEIVVRGWVQNLALPPFESEAALFAAVEAGSCDYGISSSRTAALSANGHGGGAAESVIPRPAYFDIEGIGVARHARYPESAQLLVDWMLSEEAQRKHALGAHQDSSRGDQPNPLTAERIGQKNIGLAGWHDNDAVLLAERAGYR